MEMDCMHSEVVQFISGVLQLSNTLDVNLSYIKCHSYHCLLSNRSSELTVAEVWIEFCILVFILVGFIFCAFPKVQLKQTKKEKAHQSKNLNVRKKLDSFWSTLILSRQLI